MRFSAPAHVFRVTMPKTKDPDPLHDAEQVIAQAEAIASGEAAGAGPATSAGPEAGPDSPPGSGPPSPSFADVEPLATLAVVMTDLLFVRYFGPAGIMPEPLRSEAVKAWGAIIIQYAPLISKLGPWGALLGCYAAHAMSCYATQWPIPATSSRSSGSEDQAKAPS